MNYLPPVNKLLSYGNCSIYHKWPDYMNLGFTHKHVPELIRMATDHQVHQTPLDSLEVWAPVHAWRVLGQLRAEEAIEPLTKLFQDLEGVDWMMNELPIVFGMIGPKAIPVLAEYLDDTSHGINPRVTSAASIAKVGSLNPDVRKKCVAILTKKLKKHKRNGHKLNGFLIAYLLDLKAVESIKTIRRAYRKKLVDTQIPGKLEAAEDELGFRKSPLGHLKKNAVHV